MRFLSFGRPVALLATVITASALAGALLPLARPDPVLVPVATPRAATALEIVQSTDPPRVAATQVCIAVDDSASEFGPDGTDPSGERFVAAARLVDYLAGLTVPAGTHEMAVVRFGTSAQAALRRTAVGGVGATAIRTALRPGPSLGLTNYPAAIRTCGQLLSGAPNPVVVVVGDGDPDLGDGRPLAALFTDIDAAVAGLAGVPLHVLLAVRGRLPEERAAWWRAAGARSVTDVGAGEQLGGRVTQQLISIIGGAVGVLPRPLGTLSAGHSVLPFDVPSYAPSMTVTAFAPSGQATLQIRDPTGALLRPVPGAVLQLPVSRPVHGAWRIEFVAGAPAVVQVDVLPLQARLLSPQADVAVGRPLVITAAVGDGSPPEVGAPPLYVGATVTAGGSEFELQLAPDGVGRWRSVDAAPMDVAGPVTVRLLLKAGPDTVLDATTAHLHAVATPYLVPDPPALTEGTSYGWQLYRAGVPVPDTVLGEDPRAAVDVRVGEGPEQRAGYGGRGRWLLPAGQLGAGGLPVTADLSSRLVDGTTVRDEVVSEPITSPAEPVARASHAAAFGLLAATLAGLAWIGWLLLTTNTRLDGHLREPGTGTARGLLRLRRRRWVRVGDRATRSGRVLWVRRGEVVERRGLVPWPFDAEPSRFRTVPGHGKQVTGSRAATTGSIRYPHHERRPS